MAWTSPRTWLAGEKPSAATMNQHIRDNLQFLYDNGQVVRCMAPSGNQGTTSGNQATLNLWVNRPENTDTDSIVTHSSGEFTVVKSGTNLFEIGIILRWTSNSSSYRDIYLYVNGTKKRVFGVPVGGSGSLSMGVRWTLVLTAGDTFNFDVKQAAGSLNVFGGVEPVSGFEESSLLDIKCIGAA